MTDHLGAKVSLLLDGQLGPDETEAAWAHVASCDRCSDAVAREGWVKTALAGMSEQAPGPSSDFRGLLANAPVDSGFLGGHIPRRVAVRGGGAVGIVMAGFVDLEVRAGDVPGDLRPPVAQVRGASGNVGISVVSDVSARTGSLRITPQRVSAGVPGVKMVP